MIIKLTRVKLYTIGISLVLTLILVNRLLYFYQSDITKGEVIEVYTKIARGGRYSHGTSFHPEIRFYIDSLEISFFAVENLEVEKGDTVKVLYDKNDPTNAVVYSFGGFLYIPLLYGFLFVLIILTPPIFSLMSKRTILYFDLKKIFQRGFCTIMEINTIK